MPGSQFGDGEGSQACVFKHAANHRQSSSGSCYRRTVIVTGRHCSIN